MMMMMTKVYLQISINRSGDDHDRDEKRMTEDSFYDAMQCNDDYEGRDDPGQEMR